jgi:group I intron endonuclease
MIYQYKNISGIYMIKCIVNGKFYIGSAKSLYCRSHCHFSMLRKGNHYNLYLQRTFNKTGGFVWGVIEFCEIEMLIEREQYYIDLLKPQLNLCPTAQNTLGYKMPKEVVDRLSEIRRGKFPEHLRNTNNTTEAKKKISDKAKERGLHPNFKAASIKANTGRKHSDKEIKLRVEQQKKITPDQAIEIKILRSNGIYQHDIATMFGISQRLVFRVEHGIGVYGTKDYFDAQEKRFAKAIDEPLFQTQPEPEQKKLFK